MGGQVSKILAVVAPGRRRRFSDLVIVHELQIIAATRGFDGAAALANRVYVPVPGAGFVRLAEISFGDLSGPGLFGNRDTLLDEWRRKLGREQDADN